MLKISKSKLGELFDAIAEKQTLYIPADREDGVERFCKKRSVAGSSGGENAGFKVDTNKVTIFTDKGETIEGECKSKRDVARDIVDVLHKYLAQK